MKIVTVSQMQALEKLADSSGLSYKQMMKNAGQGIANWVIKHLPVKQGVVGLVGSGNNGGDTLIALKILSDYGVRTSAYIIKSRYNDPLIKDLIKSGGSCVDWSNNKSPKYLKAALIPGVIILDGIFGTGLRLPLSGALADRMAVIYDLIENRSETRIIAVDCPSGLDCDSGESSEITIHAEHTLCMAAIKQGLLKYPGHSFTGNLICIDIGLSNLNQIISDHMPAMIDQTWVRNKIPERQENGHKGTFGNCLVIAGTKPYTGAAYLAGKAAYRSGCGLVNIAAGDEVHNSISSELIEAVWTILPDTEETVLKERNASLQSALASADALVVGPGWGLNQHQEELLHYLLSSIPKELPTVFDADALKLLPKITDWWEKIPEKSILTPHPGEMSILTGLDVHEIQANRWGTAKKYAQKWDVILILKGALTTIAHPSGKIFVIPISDSALATAGSGDVLSGMICGLLAQGWEYTHTAVIGAWMHARAGVFAKAKLGNNYSVTAMDILNAVSDVFSIF